MKNIIVLVTLFFTLNVMAEKIDVNFDERTKIKSTIFLSDNHDDIVMGWFYANGNKQMLLNVNYSSDMRIGFKAYAKDIDVDLSPYEKDVFKLPLNILTLADGGYLYKSLLSNVYYPTYFN
jgi:hypothetical protein